MELRKNQQVAKVVGYICDICKKSCDKDGEGSDEHATLSAKWGYFSDEKDCTMTECHLCEPCYEKVAAYIKSLGGEIREAGYHPFEPERAFKKEGQDYIIQD